MRGFSVYDDQIFLVTKAAEIPNPFEPGADCLKAYILGIEHPQPCCFFAAGGTVAMITDTRGWIESFDRSKRIEGPAGDEILCRQSLLELGFGRLRCDPFHCFRFWSLLLRHSGDCSRRRKGAGSSGSVIFWQENAGGRTVSLSDDPDLSSAAKRVTRQQSESVNQAEFVFAAVVLVNFPPISTNVTRKVLKRSFTRCLQRCEGNGVWQRSVRAGISPVTLVTDLLSPATTGTEWPLPPLTPIPLPQPSAAMSCGRPPVQRPR
jgi:hypothetical protein